MFIRWETLPMYNHNQEGEPSKKQVKDSVLNSTKLRENSRHWQSDYFHHVANTQTIMTIFKEPPRDTTVSSLEENIPKMFVMGFLPTPPNPSWITPDQTLQMTPHSLPLLWSRHYIYCKENLVRGGGISIKSLQRSIHHSSLLKLGKKRNQPNPLES